MLICDLHDLFAYQFCNVPLMSNGFVSNVPNIDNFKGNGISYVYLCLFNPILFLLLELCNTVPIYFDDDTHISYLIKAQHK